MSTNVQYLVGAMKPGIETTWRTHSLTMSQKDDWRTHGNSGKWWEMMEKWGSIEWSWLVFRGKSWLKTFKPMLGWLWEVTVSVLVPASTDLAVGAFKEGKQFGHTHTHRSQNYWPRIQPKETKCTCRNVEVWLRNLKQGIPTSLEDASALARKPMMVEDQLLLGASIYLSLYVYIYI